MQNELSITIHNSTNNPHKMHMKKFANLGIRRLKSDLNEKANETSHFSQL